MYLYIKNTLQTSTNLIFFYLNDHIHVCLPYILLRHCCASWYVASTNSQSQK